MINRKEWILNMQAVSKCKKQQLTKTRKVQYVKFNNNIKLIPNLDQQYSEPQLHHHHNIRLPSQINQKLKQSLPYEIRDFQDSNLTKHIAEQLLITKLTMMMVAILSIFLARISQSMDNITLFVFNGKEITLILHSLFTVTILVLAVIKHIKIRQLTIKQLIRFSPYQLNILGINYLFVFQLLWLSIHPNLLFQSQSILIKQPVYSLYINLSVNNLLQILTLTRIYLVYNAIVSSTIYLSTRGSRICRIYGTKCNLYFGFKCLFNTRPLFFLVVIFITMLFIFGEMVRLSQQDVIYSKLSIFGNSLWCVMITMGTVGYGDYYPQTYLGRAILFLASITGIIIASLLILTLSTYLSMEMPENKAHITMHRLVLREKLQELAKGVMCKAAKLSKLQRNQGQKQIKNLKKQTDDVKYTLRKIKNLIDTDNINQQMDRLFETLQDNMKDAFLNQVKYAQALKLMHEVQADKIKEMKFSFTEEIQNIIKDR